MAVRRRVISSLLALGAFYLGSVAAAQDLEQGAEDSLAQWFDRTGTTSAEMTSAVETCLQGARELDGDTISQLNMSEQWALYQLCRGAPADFRELDPIYSDPNIPVDCMRRSQYRIGPDFIEIAAQALPSKTNIYLSFFVFDDAESDIESWAPTSWSSLEQATISQSLTLHSFGYEYSYESEAAAIEVGNVTFLGDLTLGIDQTEPLRNSCPDSLPDHILLSNVQVEGEVVIHLSPYMAKLYVQESQFSDAFTVEVTQKPPTGPGAEGGAGPEQTGLYPADKITVEIKDTRIGGVSRLSAAPLSCEAGDRVAVSSNNSNVALERPESVCMPTGLVSELDIERSSFDEDLQIVGAHAFSKVSLEGVTVGHRLGLYGATLSEACLPSIRPVGETVRLFNLSASTIDACIEVFPDQPPTLVETLDGNEWSGTVFASLSFGKWGNLLTEPTAPQFLSRSSINHTNSPLLGAAVYFEANQLRLMARDSLYEHTRLRTRDAPPLLGLRSIHNTLQYEPFWTLMPFFGIILIGAVLYRFGAASQALGQLNLARRIWVSLDFTLPLLSLNNRHDALIPEEGWVHHLIYVQRLTGAVLALYFAAVLTVLGL